MERTVEPGDEMTDEEADAFLNPNYPFRDDTWDDYTVLGHCPHGVDLDREFCPKGCRV